MTLMLELALGGYGVQQQCRIWARVCFVGQHCCSTHAHELRLVLNDGAVVCADCLCKHVFKVLVFGESWAC